MSGGSFGYLCHAADFDDGLKLAIKLEDLKAMRDALRSEGADDAADATAEMVSMTEDFIAKMESKGKSLSKVWKAMEWFYSGDWGKERLDEALKEYRDTGSSGRVKIGPLDRLRRLAILLSDVPDAPPGGEILANVVADLRSRGYDVSWIERDGCWKFSRTTEEAAV